MAASFPRARGCCVPVWRKGGGGERATISWASRSVARPSHFSYPVDHELYVAAEKGRWHLPALYCSAGFSRGRSLRAGPNCESAKRVSLSTRSSALCGGWRRCIGTLLCRLLQNWLSLSLFPSFHTKTLAHIRIHICLVNLVSLYALDPLFVRAVVSAKRPSFSLLGGLRRV